MGFRAVLWDFGGVITTSPFDNFNRYEAERGLPRDFIRGVNAINHQDNAWARFESSRCTVDEFDLLFAAETAAAGHEIRGREVIGLLRHEFEDGRTALSVMLERAASPSWVCRAIGASFDVKDKLKARGYRWEPRGRFWWAEFDREEREREEWWLAANVYAVSANSRCMGPEWIERDWTVRHG